MTPVVVGRLVVDSVIALRALLLIDKTKFLNDTDFIITTPRGPDLRNILRLSYDNAKVTIDLRRTSNLQNILRRPQGFSYVRFTCKVVRSSATVFANLLTMILKEILALFKSLS